MHTPIEPPTQDLGHAPLAAPAGWYPEPTTGAGLRWWDGSAWTDHYFTEAEAGEQPPKTSGLAIAALVLGVLGALAGLLGIVLGLVAGRRIKRSEGRLTGGGLATAAIVLGVLWLALYAAGGALYATGAFDAESNADRFSGEEQEIAATVDRFQSASDDERFEEICNDIFTPRFTRLLERGAGTSCVAYYDRELGGRDQAPIDVESLEIDGSTATVLADEGGAAVEIRLVDEGGEWRIENLIER